MKTSHLLLVGALTSVLSLAPTPLQGATFTEVNWALAGTATQSSDLDNVHTAKLAIDGKTDGAWGNNSVTHTQNSDDPPWWEVDLGGVKTIGRVQVWFRTDCCQNRNDDFTLLVLDANRGEVWKKKYAGRPPTSVTYDFGPAINGQIVRVEGQTPRTSSDGYLSLAEVQVIAPYTGTISVTKNPADLSIYENQTATFGPVAAQAGDAPADKFRIQWQKSGVDIPGATAATYSTTPLLTADSGTEYSARFTLPGLVATSTKAKVTVTKDLIPPRVESTSAGSGANLQFSVNYSELMDPATATNKANYVFAGGPTVLDVTLAGPTLNTNNNAFFSTAVLSVTGLPPNAPFSLIISGAKDLAGNTIATTNLMGTVGFYEINYARAGKATQSSDLDAVHTAVLAIDGKTDGNWGANTTTHTKNSDDPPWWEVDLGAAKTIGAVSVWFRTDCCQYRNDDFTLIVLDAKRTEVSRRQYFGRPPSNVVHNFAPAIQGQIVRIEGQTPRTTSDGYMSLTEVEVIAPFQNVSFDITKGPSDATTLESRSATFGPVTAVVTGAPPSRLSFQWQKNGTDITGAIGPTYTIPLATLADNGANFGVKVLLPGLSKLSATVKLVVNRDLEPPKVASVDSVVSAGAGKFLVGYNELMDGSSSTNKANYAFAGGGSVTDVALDSSGRTAILSVSGLGAATQYSLSVTGVKDLAGNVMAVTTLHGTIQIDSALAGSASQSSDLSGATADRAIDGNTDGNFGHGSVTHTNNTDDPPVWEVDLGGAKTIGSIRVWFRTDCCQNRNDDLTVYLLDSSRKEVLRRKYPGRPPSNVVFNFAPAVMGQYVRVQGQTPRTTSDGYLALAEVQVFNPYETESINITQGPSNVTASENTKATFGPVTVDAPNVPPDKIMFQWQKNGVDIPGAFSASYTTAALSLTDNGAEYSVKALLPGLTTTAAKATLTVTKAAPPAEVKLKVAKSATGLRIAWPVSAAGFVLESTDTLSPGSWKQATDAVNVQADENAITVTGQTGTRFYRLVKR